VVGLGPEKLFNGRSDLAHRQLKYQNNPPFTNRCCGGGKKGD